MGITDRRQRQKQATREGILSAARLIARTEGWGAVTIRRVAEMIEYSPPIIYEYFKSKDTLLEELQRQGFAELGESIRQADAGQGDAQERLLQMSDAYWRFAYEQPELYQLMHGWNSTRVSLDRTLTEATKVADSAQECLEEWARAQKITLPDPAAALEIIWGLLHGLISVEMLGRVGGGEERARQLARQGIRDLLTAWTVNNKA